MEKKVKIIIFIAVFLLILYSLMIYNTKYMSRLEFTTLCSNSHTSITTYDSCVCGDIGEVNFYVYDYSNVRFNRKIFELGC